MSKIYVKHNLRYIFMLLIIAVLLSIAVIYYSNENNIEYNLFLISGYPDLNEQILYESNLYKYNNDLKNIELFKKLVDNDIGISYVEVLYDYKLVIIHTSPYSSSVMQGESFVSLISFKFNQPSIVYNYDVDIDGGSLAETNTYVVENEEQVLKYITYSPMTNENKSFTDPIDFGLWSINPINGNQHLADKELLKNQLVAYSSSPSFDVHQLNIMLVNNKYEVINNIHKVKMDWAIPEGYQIDDASKDICINVFENKHYRLLILRSYGKNIDDGTTKTIRIIVNKASNEWKPFLYKDYISSQKIFNDWLVGVIYRYGDEVSSGQNIRKSQPNKNGLSLDQFLNRRNEEAKQKMYFPGILILYDIKNEVTYEIETHQGDSEVLLFEEDAVYYRVYDEIYKADITDNGIENKELLVKDERVPDIHWAFLSEN